MGEARPDDLAGQFEDLRQRLAASAPPPSLGAIGLSAALPSALNDAAAELQRSSRSEGDVLRVVREHFAALRLWGGLIELDDDGAHFIVRAAVLQDGDLLPNLEQLLGAAAEGHRIAVDDLAACRDALSEGEAVYVGDGRDTCLRLLPRKIAEAAEQVLPSSPGAPSVCAPLATEGRVRGILLVTGEGLTEEALPAMTAFANHVGIALDNARHFAELLHANERLRADIAAREGLEQALIESEARFRGLAQSAPDAIVTLDASGRVTFWNAAAERTFGSEQGWAMGRPLCEVIVAEGDREAVRSAMRRFIETGKGVTDQPFEFAGLRADASQFVAEISLCRVRRGEAWNVIAIIRDNHERRRIEQELRKVDKLESVGLLAGGIAHDFNNMLTAMKCRIGLASRLTVDDPEARKNLEEADMAIEQARSLTSQLLTFATGGTPVRRVTALDTLVREAVGFALHGANVRCEYDLGDDLWTAEVDPSQMTQVIHNLVINADQAMSSGGTLRVHLKNTVVPENATGVPRAGRYVEIAVSDQGAGIEAEHLERVFDPFFTTKASGSGLGLATSHSIVKRHGGYISVDSRPRRGTTVRVLLEATDRSPDVRSELPREAPTGSEKVLFMDDQASIRSAATLMLSTLGYEVETAACGEEAVELLSAASERGAPFDLAILDLTVPGGLGGERVLPTLREIDPDLPAIVASGHSSSPILADFESHGFQYALKKPYGLDQMRRALHGALLRSPRSRRLLRP